MYHKNLVDGIIVLRTKTPKDLLRFARFYASKFSKKINLYASSDEIYITFRRRILGKIIGIVLVARAPRLVERQEITYLIYKDRIVLTGPQSMDGWKIRIFHLEETPKYDFSRKTTLNFKNGFEVESDILKIVVVSDIDEIIDYAFLAKDVLMFFEEKKILVTGLISRVFSSLETKIILLASNIDLEIKGSKFVDLTEGKKFVKRISLRTFKYVPLIGVKELSIYE